MFCYLKATLIQLKFKAGVGLQGYEMVKWDQLAKPQEIRDCCAQTFKKICLHHNIPDQAAALDCSLFSDRTRYRTPGR